MKCKECIYFIDDRCRRFPPVPTQYGDAIFPKVNEENFCGEFTRLSGKEVIPATTIPENMINSVTITKTKRGKKNA